MPRRSSPPRAPAPGIEVCFRHHGREERVTVEVEPGDDSLDVQREEKAHYLQTLADNGQLDGPRATHQIVTCPDGTRRLQRRRFQST
jgi:hypothetical protein